MPPKAPEQGLRVISGFFKPKRSPAPDVLVLSSDDEDDPARAPAPASTTDQPRTKRVKLEHDSNGSQLSPIASTSRSPPAVAVPSIPAVTAKSVPSTQTYKRLKAFTYDPESTARILTPEEESRRAQFVRRLVGNLRDRRSNYLQHDHYMAARHDELEASAGAELSQTREEGVGFSDDGYDSNEDSDASRSPTTTRNANKNVKGKGKMSTNDQPSPDLVSSSRFAHFAAKPTARSKSSMTKGSDTPAESAVKYTPLEHQVLALKAQHPGVLLAIEVGYKFKFYEQDAQTASRVLNIACFPQQHMLTASIPTIRLDIHVRRLLQAGHKVGIVRQLETAALKKVSENKSKPFTRALVNLYTSATFVDELGVDSFGSSSQSSTESLMCLVEERLGTGHDKVKLGLVAVSPSTGEIVYDEFEDGLMRSELETRMLHLQPSELLLQLDMSSATESMVKHLAGQHDAGVPGSTCRIERIPKRPNVSKAISNITEFYAESKKRQKREMKKVPSEIILGDSDDEGEEALPTASQKTEPDENAAQPTKVFDLPKLAFVALSSLITHLESFNLTALFLHTSSFASFSSRTSMTLNGNTIANLELLRNNSDYKEHGSLISVLDKCKTTMGKRLLRKWIAKPLVSVDAVNARLDAISEIHSANTSLALSKVRELLKTLPDLERGLSRIHFGRASTSELLRVLEALAKVGTVFDSLEGSEGGGSDAFGLESELLKKIVVELPKVKTIVQGLTDQVNQKMARDGRKEDLFEREQDWPELVECKQARDIVEQEIQGELIKARKILKKPALQFKQVSLEEYLLEVKVSERNIIPADWLRINGTKAFYRYRSPTLQKKLQELEQARERLAAAANAAYLSFLQEVASHYGAFRSTISALATLDCLFSLALVALSFNYVRPEIVAEPGKLEITNGRHPIIEQVSSEAFVANSVRFGTEAKRKQMILTGLNMGGKSSLAKSIALIALMAQIGSYVPAEACVASLFDGIYTRMGAFDSLARGRSTFMVELTETSEILKLATSRSLIILDELGRGTSTNDGEAIASAVLEWIATKLQSLTIFVTHYPNLAVLAKKFPDTISLNHMSCLESARDDSQGQGQPDVVFLFKLVEGLASSSHGLNVARMAKLPETVLEVAVGKRREFERAIKERVEQKRQDRVKRVLDGLSKLDQTRSGDDENKKKLIQLCKSVLQ
ncbi:mismatch repair protein MSH3 [Sporobolomyces koalae]|uniref:mismatch repair protein MSH3 n=1 Tax=Sporobolomyces koalae TaxID=500713 RepID=UPI003172FAB5